MYIKIQKEDSDNYLIFEGKEIETTKFRLSMSFSSYLNFLVEELSFLELDEIIDVTEFRHDIVKTFHLDKEKIVTNLSIADAKELLDNPESRSDYCGSLASITVDGQQYVTFGHIYVLNDKGQTIQSL